MLRRKLSCTCAALAVTAYAQTRLAPNDAEEAGRAFDPSHRSEYLACRVEPIRPFLDFAFRFEAGYLIACPISIFEGKQTRVRSILRVTPENAPTVVLGETYGVPAAPRATGEGLRKVKAEVRTSGAFALGEGRYIAELLLADDSGRVFTKRWKIAAERKRSERSVSLKLPPHTVEPLWAASLNGVTSQRSNGHRVTILLDAAPINPSAIKLHAWDRAFLLGTVSSLVRELPWSSVRLIAFNLDQQREIFREDDFDAATVQRLEQALQDLELGTVSYQVLRRTNGWSELLAGLTNREVTAREPADAVIFIGPHSRIGEKIPKEILKDARGASPRFFYLEYFPEWGRGAEFPDTIQYLTRERDGSTIKIHSPGEFGQAIQKVLSDLDGEHGARPGKQGL